MSRDFDWGGSVPPGVAVPLNMKHFSCSLLCRLLREYWIAEGVPHHLLRSGAAGGTLLSLQIPRVSVHLEACICAPLSAHVDLIPVSFEFRLGDSRMLRLAR